MSAKDARQPYQRIHDRSISEAALKFPISIKNCGIIGQQNTKAEALLETALGTTPEVIPMQDHDTPNNTTGETRVCRVCGTEKPIDGFYRRGDGHRNDCKSCVIARSRATILKNQEEKNEYLREYYRVNKDRILESQREYNKLHAEERAASRRAYRAKNIQRIRLAKQAYYRRNAHSIKSKTAAWAKANPDRSRELKNRSRRGKCRAAEVQARRARLVAAPGTFSPYEWDAMKKRYDHRCLCCGRQEPEIKLTMDHVVALINGGHHDASNIQTLCRSCNARKGRKAVDYRHSSLNFPDGDGGEA